MGTFMYPRTIKVARPNAQAGKGVQGYGGLSPNAETLIATGLPASIQKTGTNPNPSGTPSDVKLSTYNVLGPAYAYPAGSIVDRDVLIDDLGRRFKVVTAYIDSMGANILCLLLEA